jgi:hypothetical protein
MTVEADGVLREAIDVRCVEFGAAVSPEHAAVEAVQQDEDDVARMERSDSV